MNAPEQIIDGIRNRAERSRRVYNVSVAAMIVVALALVALFVIGASYDYVRLAEGAAEAQIVYVMYVTLAGGIIVRVGAVIVGVYVVQMMFKFARYHMRVAQHLEAAADTLELCGDNRGDLTAMMKLLSPASIDFGEPPASPGDRMLDLAKELTKKIPASTR